MEADHHPDQDPIGGLMIADGRSFRQKLRLRAPKGALVLSVTGRFQNRFDGCCRSTGRVLFTTIVAGGRLSHLTGTGFHPAQITG